MLRPMKIRKNVKKSKKPVVDDRHNTVSHQEAIVNNQETNKDRIKNTNVNFFSFLTLCVIFGIVIVAVVMVPKHFSTNTNDRDNNNLKYYRHWGKINAVHLKNVFYVLDRIGYQNTSSQTDWNLLWAHDYPFVTLYEQLKNLKPYQKINKIPGAGAITAKVDLATTGLKYIPPAFRLPKDKEKFLKYAESNPNAQFVQKNNYHRNIRVVEVSKIDFDANTTFIQKFVSDPLLIDGYKFDIGIYVVVTSINPLRIYIYNEDIALRFCPEKYEPFDANNTNKYVIADNYLPYWEVPALKHYTEKLGFTTSKSLRAYLKSINKDPTIVFLQIEDAIRTMVLAKEPVIINELKRFSSKRNFFELMRFDFVVTEDLNVYLLEANMSPNLSSDHFPSNQILFKQIIYNLFSLVGVSERITNSTFQHSFESDQMMLVEKNLMVFPNECNNLCRDSCSEIICQLCKPCLTADTKIFLKDAYLEHINKGNCKRIFPHPLKAASIENMDLQKYSIKNQLMIRWFQGKCISDESWC